MLAPFFLPGDHLTARKVCGLSVAFIGIVVLFSAKFGGGLSAALIGDAIVLSSALTIGISGIITKRVAGPGSSRCAGVLADLDHLARSDPILLAI